MFSTSTALINNNFLSTATPEDIINWGNEHLSSGKKTMNLIGTWEYLRKFTPEHWQALVTAIKNSKVEAVNMACNSLGFSSKEEWNCFCKNFSGIGKVVKGINLNSNDFDKLTSEQLKDFEGVIAGVTTLSFRSNFLNNFSTEQLDAWGKTLHGIQEIDLYNNLFHKFSEDNLKKLGCIFIKAGTKSINVHTYEFTQELMSPQISKAFLNMLMHTSIIEVLSERIFPYGNALQLEKKQEQYLDVHMGNPSKIKEITDNNLTENKRRACLTFLSGKNNENTNTALFRFFKVDTNYHITKNILQYAELPLPKNLVRN